MASFVRLQDTDKDYKRPYDTGILLARCSSASFLSGDPSSGSNPGWNVWKKIILTIGSKSLVL